LTSTAWISIYIWTNSNTGFLTNPNADFNKLQYGLFTTSYKKIQRLQSKVLRTITNAPWYVSNYTLHNDLQIPFITEEIKRYSTLYYNRLTGHENSYVTELRNPLNVRRRLKRQWPSDLKDQREEEE
jgi:hypothetical protein